ncbi:GTPase IMAP family member 7-like [Sebastes umbrosus]|uniref:GTPase IMAP family member 7-like n=1 Tax=Sebastes umbrosus TaxID=72105 RepID=UPI0018A0D23E|nr:GTPase IMAP family member 7-like [Sebastes umbrosus]
MSSKLLQPEMKVPPTLKILLVGMTGGGRTSAMNVLLGRPGLTQTTASSQTTECKIEEREFNGQQLVVIDTPGLMHTEKGEDQVKKDIMECIAAAAPGPHVFLLVMKSNRPTDGDKRTMEIIQEIFGPESKNYTLALFTGGDEFQPKDEDVQKTFLKGNIVGHHTFDNTGKKFPDQVPELLKKINNMVRKNGEEPIYTCDMLRKVQEVKVQEMEKFKGDGPKEEQVLRNVVHRLLSGLVGEDVASSVLAKVDGLVKKVCDIVK